MPTVLMIQGEPETIHNDEQFARMLDERLGYEAAEYFRDAVADRRDDSENQCDGECDVVYEMQENYENILRDIRDEVGSWAIHRLTKKELLDRRDALYARIEREL